MTLRGRLTAMAALIVGVILTVGAIACYVVMRNELRGQIDSSLRSQAELFSGPLAAGVTPFTVANGQLPRPIQRPGEAVPFVQFISASGATRRPQSGGLRVAVTPSDRAVAEGRVASTLTDRHARGVHLRVVTVGIKHRGAIQLGRSLASVDRALRRLRLALIVIVVAGVALALGLSRLFAGRVIAPIRQLTAATEHIEATGDLGRRVETNRTDEVGELARRFNAMLERVQSTQTALEHSTAAQRQLVADASHELRTPVSSLRTNIEFLLAAGHLDARARRTVLEDVVEQTDELSTIVADLIELARGDHPPAHVEEVDLGAIAEEAAARARRHTPTVQLRTEIEPWTMLGSPELLGRAVNNVLDNAVKFSPPGSTIELRAAAGEVSVRDHGPGVAEADLPHLFDRFFRARGTSEMQGSGLGLAIVKQVVEAHGGSVAASPAEGEGLLVQMRFSPDGGFVPQDGERVAAAPARPQHA